MTGSSDVYFGLTPRQGELLAYLRRYIGERGCSPSFVEIGEQLGVAKGAVHRLVHSLKDRGHIMIDPQRRRSIALRSPPSPKPEAPTNWHDRVRSVRLPPKLDQALQDIARRAHVSPNRILVEALRDYILEQPIGRAA